MSGKPYRFRDPSHVIELYKSGLTCKKIASQLGVKDVTVSNALKRAGILVKRQPFKIDYLPEQEITDLYTSGNVSEFALSKRYGVDRSTIHKIILAHGITPRTQSETERIKWARMSPEQRVAQVAAAHQATLGRKHTEEERHKMALAQFISKKHTSPIEQELIKLINDRGISCEGQFPVGRYNLDIAIHIPPIAVEIFGGGWHGYGHHKAIFLERTEYLLNNGWSVLVIWINTKRHPLRTAVCDHIIAFMDELSSNPTARGQYRMVFGDGESVPIASRYFNDRATIEALGCVR